MKRKTKNKIKEIEKQFTSRDDALGSYTGNALNGEKPTQDADDL